MLIWFHGEPDVNATLDASAREWVIFRLIVCCRLPQAQLPPFQATLAAYSHILAGSLTVSAVKYTWHSAGSQKYCWGIWSPSSCPGRIQSRVLSCDVANICSSTPKGSGLRPGKICFARPSCDSGINPLLTSVRESSCISLNGVARRP
jgi:hypothetical protein